MKITLAYTSRHDTLRNPTEVRARGATSYGVRRLAPGVLAAGTVRESEEATTALERGSTVVGKGCSHVCKRVKEIVNFKEPLLLVVVKRHPRLSLWPSPVSASPISLSPVRPLMSCCS